MRILKLKRHSFAPFKSVKIMNKQFEKLADSFGQILEDQQNKYNQKSQQNQHPLHIQQSGMAHYDHHEYFLFTPDNPAAGLLSPFRSIGVGQMLSDGTFDFVRQPRLRTQSQLILKLAHGRVSKTKDGAIQLTLKVYQDEGINISQAIAQEAQLAKDAIVAYQLKR